MHCPASVRVLCSIALLAASLLTAAEPGKITKYVLPDGTIVYSDKPVPGATIAGEIVVAPAPVPPAAAPPAHPAPENATDALPPAPDDTPPVIAEDSDGKCRLRVLSGWQWVEIRASGLVPGERYVMELRANDQLTLHKATASDTGEGGWSLYPAQIAKASPNTITVSSSHCEMSASFRWPQ